MAELQERQSPDKWIAGDMVFITGGKGYGVADNLDTICIGDEKDIQSYLIGSVIPDSIQGRGRQVLIEIKELTERGNTNGRQPQLQRPGAFRGRIAGKTKRGVANIKSATFRKRLPVSSTKR